MCEISKKGLKIFLVDLRPLGFPPHNPLKPLTSLGFLIVAQPCEHCVFLAMPSMMESLRFCRQSSLPLLLVGAA